MAYFTGEALVEVGDVREGYGVGVGAAREGSRYRLEVRRWLICADSGVDGAVVVCGDHSYSIPLSRGQNVWLGWLDRRFGALYRAQRYPRLAGLLSVLGGVS